MEVALSSPRGLRLDHFPGAAGTDAHTAAQPPTQVCDSTDGPALTLSQQARPSFSAMPPQVLACVIEFLDSREVMAALACTSRAIDGGLAQAHDPYLRALSVARVSGVQADIDKAIADIVQDRAIHADWRRRLEGQVNLLRQSLACRYWNFNIASGLADMMVKLNRASEAPPLLQWCLAVRPTGDSAVRHMLFLADVLLMTRDLQQAVAVADKILDLEPLPVDLRAAAMVHKANALLLLAQGKGESPLASLAILEAAPDSPLVVLPALAMVHHALGNEAQCAAATTRFKQQFPAHMARLALIHAWCGQVEAAVRSLEAVALSPHGLFLSNMPNSPFIPDEIKRNKRWAAGMRRICRSPVQLEDVRFHIAVPALSDPAGTVRPAH